MFDQVAVLAGKLMVLVRLIRFFRHERFAFRSSFKGDTIQVLDLFWSPHLVLGLAIRAVSDRFVGTFFLAEFEFERVHASGAGLAGISVFVEVQLDRDDTHGRSFPRQRITPGL
jgi:hypothetical protein